MSDLKLGELITTPQNRDAIHVAVAPAFAFEALEPGYHVALLPGLPSFATRGSIMNPTIGVVDPFLKGPVKKGQQFWLFMYPGIVTGLRHEWTHPSFAPIDLRTQKQIDEDEDRDRCRGC